MEMKTYFMPRHCLVPLLNATIYFLSSPEEGCSQRSGLNEWGEGKIVGLLWMRGADMLTGVCVLN